LGGGPDGEAEEQAEAAEEEEVMAKRCNRKGWKKEGIKVRQKQPGGPWWVFLTVNGKRRSKCVGTDRAAADTLADEWRAGMKLLGVMPSATVEDFQRVGALQPAAPTNGAAAITFGVYADRFMARYEPSADPEQRVEAFDLG
jgi:hypothetical protein